MWDGTVRRFLFLVKGTSRPKASLDPFPSTIVGLRYSTPAIDAPPAFVTCQDGQTQLAAILLAHSDWLLWRHWCLDAQPGGLYGSASCQGPRVGGRVDNENVLLSPGYKQVTTSIQILTNPTAYETTFTVSSIQQSLLDPLQLSTPIASDNGPTAAQFRPQPCATNLLSSTRLADAPTTHTLLIAAYHTASQDTRFSSAQFLSVTFAQHTRTMVLSTHHHTATQTLATAVVTQAPRVIDEGSCLRQRGATLPDWLCSTLSAGFPTSFRSTRHNCPPRWLDTGVKAVAFQTELAIKRVIQHASWLLICHDSPLSGRLL
ncbi:hypothetical protein F66182_518 [Fusarium sp. NRRL 66182]|nr:hypothetical protein F66182_518 [Fusarium sp. NRRL 66182]